MIAKTIGDALMLIGTDPRDLLQTTVNLVEQVTELSCFPAIRAGVTQGQAHERAGEWYGETVNLANRITKAAPAGVVLATDAVRNQVPEGFSWKPFSSGKLNGVQRRPRLYAVTRTIQSEHSRPHSRHMASLASHVSGHGQIVGPPDTVTNGGKS